MGVNQAHETPPLSLEEFTTGERTKRLQIETRQREKPRDVFLYFRSVFHILNKCCHIYASMSMTSPWQESPRFDKKNAGAPDAPVFGGTWANIRPFSERKEWRDGDEVGHLAIRIGLT